MPTEQQWTFDEADELATWHQEPSIERVEHLLPRHNNIANASGRWQQQSRFGVTDEIEASLQPDESHTRSRTRSPNDVSSRTFSKLCLGR